MVRPKSRHREEQTKRSSARASQVQIRGTKGTKTRGAGEKRTTAEAETGKSRPKEGSRTGAKGEHNQGPRARSPPIYGGATEKKKGQRPTRANTTEAKRGTQGEESLV